MASVEVALHGGHGLAHQAERHVAVGRRLVLDEHVNVAVAGGGFQAVKYFAVVGAQTLFHKAAGFELQRAEVADGAKLRRQMQLDKVPGGVGVRQESFEGRIVWNGCHFHSES